MNDNLKELRKELHLSMAKFGKEIGYSPGAVCDMESGKCSIANRVVALICDKFNVSEDWLRNGKGEMFRAADPFNLNEISKKYEMNDLERALFVEYMKLPTDIRSGFLDAVQRAVESVKVEPSPTISKAIPADISVSASLTEEEAVELARMRYRAAQKGSAKYSTSGKQDFYEGLKKKA